MKPTRITTPEGKVYELVPASTKGNETGDVEAGKTTEVIYVYKKVKIPETPETPGTPSPSTPTTPAKPVSPTMPSAPVDGEAIQAPVAPSEAKGKAELPNTGTEDHVSLTALGLLGVLSGFGFVARKRKED